MAKSVAEKLFEEPLIEATETKPEVSKPEAVTIETTTFEVPKQPVTEPLKPVEARPQLEAIPHATALEWRDRMKDAEKRLKEQESAQRNKPEQIPSAQVDPEAFAAYIQEQTARAVTSERFNISEELATAKHGEEAVKAAMEWGIEKSQRSPAFASEYLKQRNPIDWAVRQHKKEKLVSEFGDDEATQKAYIERRARELGLIPSPVTQAPNGAVAHQPVSPTVPKATPSPSLLHAPSAGGLQTKVVPPNPVMKKLFNED